MLSDYSLTDLLIYGSGVRIQNSAFTPSEEKDQILVLRLFMPVYCAKIFLFMSHFSFLSLFNLLETEKNIHRKKLSTEIEEINFNRIEGVLLLP